MRRDDDFFVLGVEGQTAGRIAAIGRWRAVRAPPKDKATEKFSWLVRGSANRKRQPEPAPEKEMVERKGNSWDQKKKKRR